MNLIIAQTVSFDEHVLNICNRYWSGCFDLCVRVRYNIVDFQYIRFSISCENRKKSKHARNTSIKCTHCINRMYINGMWVLTVVDVDVENDFHHHFNFDFTYIFNFSRFVDWLVGWLMVSRSR